MGIKNTEFFEENGVQMRRDTYDNGMTITQAANPPAPPEPQPLSEQEHIAIDTALNTEYIACLLESQLAI